jgi:lycopene cyclase domain-containing protein
LLIVLTHAVIAVVYTTPWDNYLVATGVWWYDPALVMGIRLGWVPLEEYLFFVLQPLLVGLVVLRLARRLPPEARPLPARAARALRLGAAGALGAAWLGAAGVLAAGWAPGTYLALTLAWALPPIMLQVFVGADLLWRMRRLAGAAVLLGTAYLSAADVVAIGAGTWTIDPAQSLPIRLGGVLPVEEVVFFGLTCTLLAFGIALSLHAETAERVRALVRAWRSAGKGEAGDGKDRPMLRPCGRVGARERPEV